MIFVEIRKVVTTMGIRAPSDLGGRWPSFPKNYAVPELYKKYARMGKC